MIITNSYKIIEMKAAKNKYESIKKDNPNIKDIVDILIKNTNECINTMESTDVIPTTAFDMFDPREWRVVLIALHDIKENL